MNAQSQFIAWLEEASRLNITQKDDLRALYQKVSELNTITQQAESEGNFFW